MSACQAAKIEKKIAQLSTDFGLALFLRKAGSEADSLLAKMGKYSKGKNAGKYKGCIVWFKVISGGFDYYHSKQVVYPNTSYGYKLAKDFEDALSNYDECHPLKSKAEEKEILRAYIVDLESEIEALTHEINKTERYIKRQLEKGDIAEAEEYKSELEQDTRLRALKLERLENYRKKFLS